MSRWVMKPLFSMSHIWKNSRTVAGPMSRLCCAARGTDVPPSPPPPLRRLAARAADEAAMSLASPSLREPHVPGSVGAAEGEECPGKIEWTFSAAPHQKLIADVTCCHLLATSRVAKSIKTWERDGRRALGLSGEISREFIQIDR